MQTFQEALVAHYMTLCFGGTVEMPWGNKYDYYQIARAMNGAKSRTLSFSEFMKWVELESSKDSHQLQLFDVRDA